MNNLIFLKCQGISAESKEYGAYIKGGVGSKTIYSKAAIEEGEVIIVVKKD